MEDNTEKTIYFAGGCFWGTEHLFSLVPGVTATRVGYANSRVADPTYELVCSGTTGAAETVEVTFNPRLVGLTQLVDLYLKSVDPTSVNRQGDDCGTQYRTGIYYAAPADAQPVFEALRRLAAELGRPVAIESGPIENFYPAEEYHQQYLRKNPGGYCHVNPALFKEAARTAR